MKTLRPITVLFLGPAALSIAMGCAEWFALPHSHSFTDTLWVSGLGLAAGLVFFGPIAALLKIRDRHPEWLCRIGWYTSLIMLFALGYLAACVRLGTFDLLTLVCMGVVGICAAIKIGLSNEAQRHEKLAD
jgi:hypothetical protein